MKSQASAVLRKHGPLIPLYVCVAAGSIGAVAFAIRSALKNPDVQWKRSGEIPNEEFRDKQFKLFSPTMDYSKISSPAPKY